MTDQRVTERVRDSDHQPTSATLIDTEVINTDVLVIGGGPAATWAAESAVRTGARVVLVDKGYCGTSGAAAASGNNLWYVPPGPQRAAAVERRARQAQGLADPALMSRVLETTWDRLLDLADWGYPFPVEEDGSQRRTSLQGPEYLRRMRRRIHRIGVRILDHHPALELLADSDGVIRGAAGIARQQGGRWQATAGAVVLATGGCAFLSGAYGTNVDTGDGQLMAAEAGAELSGMEFTTHYGPSAAWGAHTKGRMLQFATLYDRHGDRIEVPADGSVRSVAMEHELRGEQVFVTLADTPPELREMMRLSQPNYFVPLEKAGVDVFTDRYPLRMVYEGTVRGTGGLRILDADCRTSVPGLYAAGDAATRELITGGISGGGSYNGAWAISSGTFAGRAAARFAASDPGPVGDRDSARLRPLGRVGIRPTAAVDPGLGEKMIAQLQDRMLPPHLVVCRTESELVRTAAVTDELWELAGEQLGGRGRAGLRAREVAAMIANARWITAAARRRTESRGMHRRLDHPELGDQQHRILVGGLEQLWTRPDRTRPDRAVPDRTRSGGNR